MAVRPTSDENARTALSAFSAKTDRPGYWKPMGFFNTFMATNKIPADDMNEGTERAIQLGWMTRENMGLRLTEAGFAAL